MWCEKRMVCFGCRALELYHEDGSLEVEIFDFRKVIPNLESGQEIKCALGYPLNLDKLRISNLFTQTWVRPDKGVSCPKPTTRERFERCLNDEKTHYKPKV